MNQLPAQKVDGLIDGMAVLEELASHNEPISGVEIARKLNLQPVRVNRLLKTFAYLGYTYRTSSRQYLPGPALHILAVESMAASGLLRKAYPYLEKLSAGPYPVVALGVLWKEKVCYLFHRNNGTGMGSGLSPNFVYDWKASSLGHVLMAERDDSEIPESSREIMESLRFVREHGYAVVKHHDHYSLAVKVGRPAFAALAVSRIPTLDDVPALAKTLRQYAAEIEK